MATAKNTTEIQVKKTGEVIVNGKAMANLEAAQEVIAKNATKKVVPMLTIVGDAECTIEVGKLVSGAHWAGYPSEKIEARCWE